MLVVEIELEVLIDYLQLMTNAVLSNYSTPMVEDNCDHRMPQLEFLIELNHFQIFLWLLSNKFKLKEFSQSLTFFLKIICIIFLEYFLIDSYITFIQFKMHQCLVDNIFFMMSYLQIPANHRGHYVRHY